MNNEIIIEELGTRLEYHNGQLGSLKETLIHAKEMARLWKAQVEDVEIRLRHTENRCAAILDDMKELGYKS